MQIRQILVWVALLAVAISPLHEPAAVHAAVRTVDAVADEHDGSCSDGDCSLRDALHVASPGETVDFGVSGTIALSLGALGIDRPLTVRGPGAGELTISGGDATGVFTIGTEVDVAILDLTIADGHTHIGGAVDSEGRLTLSGCTLSNHSSDDDGGAI